MNVHFRDYIEADAGPVILLLRETYGGSYIRQGLYKPRTLNEFNRSGRLKMTVTVSEAGQVIGVVGRESSRMFKNQCAQLPN